MGAAAPEHLGPRLSAKPMHMFWLLDVSGSMSVDRKIESLNDAMLEAINAVRDAAAQNPGVQVKARVITFAHDAAWHAEDPIDIEEFEWSNVEVVERGTTELGRAISLATRAIREVAAAGRGLPPALILVSDGKPTDLKSPSFGAALRELAEEPWGRKASRIAVGIGKDADMEALHRFIGHDEIMPIRASNAAELTHYLRWASTVAVDERTRPAFGWSSTPESPGREADELMSDSSSVKAKAEPEPPTTPAPRTGPQEAPIAPVPPQSTKPAGPPQTDLPPLAAEEPTQSPPAPVTELEEQPTQPPKTEVEEPPTQPAPHTDPEETRTEPAPHTELEEAPTAPVPPQSTKPTGPPRVDLPPPAEDEPTQPAPVVTDTEGRVAEDESKPPKPPQGSRRMDLPPPPGLGPPPPPERPEEEGPVW